MRLSVTTGFTAAGSVFGVMILLVPALCRADTSEVVGFYDGSVLPTQAEPAWRAASGQANESIVDGRWLVEAPQDFSRAIDFGPIRRTTGQENIVEFTWATTCQNNAFADGLCIHTQGKRLRLQPIHRSEGADQLLTGTSSGLSPDIEACYVDLSNVENFDATKLNRFRVRWVTDAADSFMFELSLNGEKIAELPGVALPVKRSTLSFEFRSGTQTIDEVRWRLKRGGEVVPSRELASARELLAQGRRQLFLDDTWIERMEGLTRVVNQPKKHEGNPVIRHHQKPWQTFRAQLYGTVLYIPEEKLFKMWYLAGARFPGEQPIRLNGRVCCPNFQMLAYAESKDGFDWELPNLGLVEFDGTRDNNICQISRENAEGVAVVYDPRDSDGKRRYKAFYWEHDNCGPKKYGPTTPVNGMSVSFSADGKTWTNCEANPVIDLPSDTGHQALWDGALRKYVAFGRFGAGGRKIARAESDDFVNWSPPRLVFQTDAKDGPGAQFYGMGITRYEGIYVGLPWLFWEGTSDRIDVQLAASRDGIDWKRAGDRQTFIPNGPKGSFDAGCIFTAAQPVQLVGDTIYIFYSGIMLNHEEPRPSRKEHPEYGESSIGVATLRRDGFVSLDADDEPGRLITRSFVWPAGKELHLNADADDGNVAVSLLSEARKPLNTSNQINGNHTDATVVWSQKLVPPRGLVRLQFEVRNAKMYSFWFE